MALGNVVSSTFELEPGDHLPELYKPRQLGQVNFEVVRRVNLTAHGGQVLREWARLTISYDLAVRVSDKETWHFIASEPQLGEPNEAGGIASLTFASVRFNGCLLEDRPARDQQP